MNLFRRENESLVLFVYDVYYGYVNHCSAIAGCYTYVDTYCRGRIPRPASRWLGREGGGRGGERGVVCRIKCNYL